MYDVPQTETWQLGTRGIRDRPRVYTYEPIIPLYWLLGSSVQKHTL
jgi:hypothetical protein